MGSLEAKHKRTKGDCERRIRQLQSALEEARVEARDEAYQTQHFYAAALSDLLGDIRADLERTPPDVDAAVARIRKALASDRPAA